MKHLAATRPLPRLLPANQNAISCFREPPYFRALVASSKKTSDRCVMAAGPTSSSGTSNAVVPVAAEVVDILHRPGAGSAEQPLPKIFFASIRPPKEPFESGRPPTGITDAELVKMAVCPAHGSWRIAGVLTAVPDTARSSFSLYQTSGLVRAKVSFRQAVLRRQRPAEKPSRDTEPVGLASVPSPNPPSSAPYRSAPRPEHSRRCRSRQKSCPSGTAGPKRCP